MVTIYHNLDPALSAHRRESDFWERCQPQPSGLELAGVVAGTEDLTEAFDHAIHRDGENWTDNEAVMFFGNRRGRRSSQEGDVFVSGDGMAYLVLPLGFRALPGLRLPFLP